LPAVGASPSIDSVAKAADSEHVDVSVPSGAETFDTTDLARSYLKD
jgi:hypothetical protein